MAILSTNRVLRALHYSTKYCTLNFDVSLAVVAMERLFLHEAENGLGLQVFA